MGWAALHGTPAGISHRPERSARGAGGDQPRAGPLCPGRRRGSAMGWAALHGTPTGISHGLGRSLPGAAGPVRRYLRTG
ncbi:hypothetical protein BK140_09935 [Paenibacillus macerans]|nr:hypothetical protein BK140_09935 [Paenibacillus macerans]